jgi:hypothetical protein
MHVFPFNNSSQGFEKRIYLCSNFSIEDFLFSRVHAKRFNTEPLHGNGRNEADAGKRDVDKQDGARKSN